MPLHDILYFLPDNFFLQALVDLVTSKVPEAAGGRKFEVVASLPGEAQVFLLVLALMKDSIS